MGQKERGELLYPFHGQLGPRLIQCGLGRGLLPYQVVSSFIQPFAHNWHEPKTRGSAPFRGELRPHLTQRRLGQGLPLYQVASWSNQPFGHNIHGPKIRSGGCALFLGVAVAWAEAYVHTSCMTTTNVGTKLGAVPFSGGELGPHLTQCRVGQGLPPYQVASWSMQPFGHNKCEPKIGGSVPFWEGNWVPI